MPAGLSSVRANKLSELGIGHERLITAPQGDADAFGIVLVSRSTGTVVAIFNSRTLSHNCNSFSGGGTCPPWNLSFP
jgi:hypothetical protein